jgi:uncharacterized protein (TIGR02996 family)
VHLDFPAMNRADAFLDDIVRHPADDGPRLVYADWLDEQGDPARAEFIRVQCTRARGGPGDEQDGDLALRERVLLREHGKHWAGALRHKVRRYAFRRGFVEAVTLPAADFLQQGEALFRLAPIREVRLVGVAPLAADLAASPLLARLRGLDLRHEEIGTDHLRTLLRSRQFPPLEALVLRGTALCNNTGLRVLAGAEPLRALRSLDVGNHRNTLAASHTSIGRGMRELTRRIIETGGGPAELQTMLALPEYAAYQEAGVEQRANRIDGAGLEALAESPHMAHLTELGLAGIGRLSLDAIQTLADSGLLGRLTALDVSRSPGGDRWLPALLHAPAAAGLRVLDLSENKLGVERGWEDWRCFAGARLDALTSLNLQGNGLNDGRAARLLADTPCLGRLAVLNLRFTWMTPEALEVLAGSPHLGGLAALDLDVNHLDDRALAALAAGRLTGLRRLSVQGMGKTGWRRNDTWITSAGVKALAASPAAGRLQHLDLGNQRVGDEGLSALLDSPHLAGLRGLRLWANAVTDAGVARLLASHAGAGLREIDLRANPLSAGARRALRNRHGWGALFGDGPEPRNDRHPVDS